MSQHTLSYHSIRSQHGFFDVLWILKCSPLSRFASLWSFVRVFSDTLTLEKHPASPLCTGGQTIGRSVSTGPGLAPASGSLGLFKTNSASHDHRQLHYISRHIVSSGATRFKGRQTFMLGELRFTLRSFYKVEVQWKLRVHSCHRFQELLTFAWQFTLVSDQYYVSQVNLDALRTS